MNSPRLKTWSNELSIGNPDIDLEHQKLIDIYNQLVVLSNEIMNRNEFAKLLSEMTDYSLTHFKREQLYMQEMNYPDFDKHVSKHQEYIYQVAIFNRDFTTLNPPKIENILEFLDYWWENHIIKDDNEYEMFKRKSKSLLR